MINVSIISARAAAVPILAAAFGCGSLRDEATAARASNGYHDDTALIPANAAIRTLSGDQPVKRWFMPPKDVGGPLFLDLREARFTLNNSGNPDPTADRPCDSGVLPIDKYPVNIFSADRVTVVGGAIRGSVPQSSDWRSSYCDSAAVNFKYSPAPAVDGTRISGAWDGIRIGPGSGNFVIRNSWLSHIRDDAVENDHLYGGRIEDTLIDGTYQALSVRPIETDKVGPSADLVEFSGVLIRFTEYPYEGQPLIGALVKFDTRAPRIKVENSVIAIDSQASGFTRSWKFGWTKLAGASNNLVLWLSDRDMPRGLDLPPSGFRLLAGAPARKAWAEATRNWIDCHPKVRRLPGDPPSNFARCRAGVWGGFTR